MNHSQAGSLGKTVEAKATTRPIKIAYVVPSEEVPVNHLILDAVFHESYTRWAGAYTVVVPANTKEFLHAGYQTWLDFFDPDFVYSYVGLEPRIVEVIDRTCSPIGFLGHKMNGRGPDHRGWRAFTPDWGLYFKAVSSMTTISSPQSHPISLREPDIETHVTVATQYPTLETRLFRDNFGTAFDPNNITYPIPGLYRTLCLVPQDLPLNHGAGTERCTSMEDIISAISKRRARPIARFAMVHSEAIPKAESHLWSNSFNLFVGSSLLDRIHFWNARHFTPHYAGHIGSLILEPDFFNSPALITILGEYLNNNNCLGHNSGEACVSIRSYSQNEEKLRSIADLLRKKTYNSVAVEKTFCLPAVPSEEDLKRSFHRGQADTSTLKLNEDSNSLTAKQPNHFEYIPPRYKRIACGQWIIELDIQRHNNLSKLSNVIDTWQLPRRRNAVEALTNNLGKITRGHRLAILPRTNDFPFVNDSINQDPSYTLSLPSDDTFFRSLVLDGFKHAPDDVRATIVTPLYKDLQLSDKGQNLRGIISMFSNLSNAHEVLTNKFWRRVLREGNGQSVKRLVFTRNQLRSYLPNNQVMLEELRKKLHFQDTKKVSRYLERNLADTLEYLVRLNIFYCVYQWRCEYCGHTNGRNFDTMKIKNECEICSTQHFAPIDLEWTYQLNDFVYRSLVTQTGLPVLWTLGFLQNQLFRGSFWYLPEVNLYAEHNAPESSKEIDILCIHDGKFIAVEVKRSAKQLIDNKGQAIDSFVEKMNLIRPDIAMLSFEQYCQSSEEVEETKTQLSQASQEIQSKLEPAIGLRMLVACDEQGFNDTPTDLGYIGERTDEFE